MVCGGPAVCTYEHIWARFPIHQNSDGSWNFTAPTEPREFWEISCEANEPTKFFCAKHEKKWLEENGHDD